MSEKVTFGELIESIAAETDHSKQFTHDFLKDFVDVIHGGLEEDGKVNIAGFGKFKLRHVEEREGYNPQTEEKMTIPAHNKIVFKPYKDLSELVNAPYAHMEPTLLEERSNESGNPRIFLTLKRMIKRLKMKTQNKLPIPTMITLSVTRQQKTNCKNKTLFLLPLLPLMMKTY